MRATRRGKRPSGGVLLATFAAAAAAVAVPATMSTASAAADDHGLLFRLDKRGVPASYVLGTVHSSDPRVLALPAPVWQALAAARTFALENRLGEGDVEEFFAAAQFEDGRRLGDFFDPPTVELIAAALADIVPDRATVERLKPWAIVLKLAERPAAVADGHATLDRALLAEARRRRLAVIGLEAPDEQVAAFDAIPMATQVALVRFVLGDRNALTRDHDAVIAAWLERDLAQLAALNAAPGRRDPAIAPHLAVLTRRLVDDRSILMAHRLFIPLRAGRVFVAVEALHLYGEHGLLALLRMQGYRVRRLYRRGRERRRRVK